MSDPKNIPFLIRQMENLLCIEALLDESEICFELAEEMNKANPEPKNRKDIVRNTAYFRAAIASYGKCFSSAQGRTKLDFNEIFKNQSPSIKTAHGRLMDLRHKYVAHNEAHDRPKFYFKEFETQVLYDQSYSVYMPALEFDSFRSTITAVRAHVKTRMNLCLDKMSEAFKKPLQHRRAPSVLDVFGFSSI